VGGDDFAAAGVGASEIGAKHGAEIFVAGFLFVTEGEMNFVADEAHEALAGSRSHDRIECFHLKYFYQEAAGGEMQKRNWFPVWVALAVRAN
jgi:hypothetical protein